jgi:hypothetical protein
LARPLSPGASGLLASVGSSLAFGGVYFITPLLAPASAESIWGIRNLVTIPIIALALIGLRQWYVVPEIARRIRRRPLLLLGIFVCGLLIAAQLWVFSWAPLHGRGLQVALGYFMLPRRAVGGNTRGSMALGSAASCVCVIVRSWGLRSAERPDCADRRSEWRSCALAGRRAADGERTRFGP